MIKFHDNPSAEFNTAKKVYYCIFAFSLIWLMLIISAPLLKTTNATFEKISDFIYMFFSNVCHQHDSRSLHLFDNKLGVCSRCLWIYSGFFFGTLIYSFKYKLSNTNPPSIMILIISAVAMVIDVLLDSLGILENTTYSRFVTGIFLGLALPFFIIPGFVKFFDEINSFLRSKVNI